MEFFCVVLMKLQSMCCRNIVKFMYVSLEFSVFQFVKFLSWHRVWYLICLKRVIMKFLLFNKRNCSFSSCFGGYNLWICSVYACVVLEFLCLSVCYIRIICFVCWMLIVEAYFFISQTKLSLFFCVFRLFCCCDFFWDVWRIEGGVSWI